jgi:beta-1,2-mannobiose phosphorylase / 1,2-beta-oligomannan phosphorylase
MNARLAGMCLAIVLAPSIGRGLEPANPNANPTARAILDDQDSPTTAGWVKHPENPVLGGALGTCFDVALLQENTKFRMWFSWRPKKSLALVESSDGIHWNEPVIVLGPKPETGWEDDINRPVVVKRTDGYHLWYTGQAKDRSWIGYATSADGKSWVRQSDKPVLSADAPWEKVAVMCPHVLWDEGAKLFRMWYSGGDQYEPDAIGYATSPDGRQWTKYSGNPVFQADKKQGWEQHKVTACQVVPRGDWYYMFYIGFRDEDHAQIGIARSRDGITGWERLPANPVIRPTPNQWDHDACYKPFALFDGQKWRLWYNGRHANVEQIGLAIHEGESLGF